MPCSTLQPISMHKYLTHIWSPFMQISLRCSEVAPGIKPSVEGQDGADWCVVDAGLLSSFRLAPTGRYTALHCALHTVHTLCTMLHSTVLKLDGTSRKDFCAGSIIVHVFSQDTRGLYDLDSLWREGNNMTRIEPAHQTTHTLQTIDADTSYHLSHI